MGVEKRRRKRVPKRVTVHFGEHDFSRSGIIEDVSTSGAFVVASYLPPLGTRVHLQLMLGQKQFVYLECEVKRHRNVLPQLRQIEKTGFGVHFLTPVELMHEVAPQLKAMGAPVHEDADAPAAAPAPPPVAPAAREPSLDVVFAEVSDLKRAWDREMRFGGLYVLTAEAVARDAPVTVRVKLGFAGGKEFTFAAKVMQILTGASKGLGLAFQDRTAVEQTLLPFLGLKPPS